MDQEEIDIEDRRLLAIIVDHEVNRWHVTASDCGLWEDNYFIKDRDIYKSITKFKIPNNIPKIIRTDKSAKYLVINRSSFCHQFKISMELFDGF